MCKLKQSSNVEEIDSETENLERYFEDDDQVESQPSDDPFAETPTVVRERLIHARLVGINQQRNERRSRLSELTNSVVIYTWELRERLVAEARATHLAAARSMAARLAEYSTSQPPADGDDSIHQLQSNPVLEQVFGSDGVSHPLVAFETLAEITNDHIEDTVEHNWRQLGLRRLTL